VKRKATDPYTIISVSAPDYLIPDHYPALQAESQSGSGSGSASGSMVLMTKNGEKFTAGKNLIFFFISKIAIYLSLGLQKGRPNYRGSL
jgi:hypothetical protein